MNCLIVLSLAVLGASAAPCFNTVSTGCAPALPGRTFIAQTPIIENPTRIIPSCVPQTSVSQSCHCLKTIVRPQLRNEVITVPEVDRIVRVVPSPVVEVSTVNIGGDNRNVQIPTCGFSSGVVGGVNGGFSSGVVGGVNSGFSSGVVIGGSYGIGGGVIGGSSGLGGVISVGNTGCGSNIFA